MDLAMNMKYHRNGKVKNINAQAENWLPWKRVL